MFPALSSQPGLAWDEAAKDETSCSIEMLPPFHPPSPQSPTNVPSIPNYLREQDTIHKTRLTRCFHESALVKVKVAKVDTLVPPTGGDRELEVVGAEHAVGDTGVNGRLEALARSKQVLRDACLSAPTVITLTDPEHEDRCSRNLEVLEWVNVERGPAVHHGQEGEVGVGLLDRTFVLHTERELIKHALGE